MKDQRGHWALRRGRWSIEGQIYLVTFATKRRRRVFTNFRNGCRAARILSRGDYWLGASVLAWVLMPDHFHGLIQLDIGSELSRCVSRAKMASALAVNQPAGHRGSLWQKAFHDHALRKEEDLHSVARYVVANPIRARIVRRVQDYPFWDAVWL